MLIEVEPQTKRKLTTYGFIMCSMFSEKFPRLFFIHDVVNVNSNTIIQILKKHGL